MKRNLKISLFRTTVETVLLLGSSTWILTKTIERKLAGTDTRMARESLNVNWRSHTPNRELYGSLQKTSRTLSERRLKFSGHYYRNKDEIISKVSKR